MKEISEFNISNSPEITSLWDMISYMLKTWEWVELTQEETRLLIENIIFSEIN